MEIPKYNEHHFGSTPVIFSMKKKHPPHEKSNRVETHVKAPY